MEKTAKRNYGIDLLRIISMYMVVILHINGYGGILENSTGISKSVAWLLEIICYCAVDIFAIISGFVGYSDTEKAKPYGKLLPFWLQVFFYSFGITLIFFIINHESVGLTTLIKSAMPIATKQYWYASSYFGLMLIIPFINKFLRKLSRRDHTILVLIIVLAFSVFGTFSSRFSDPFQLSTGYSLIWLAMLYIIGAYIKKYQIQNLLKKRILGLIIIGCTVFTWAWKIFAPGFLNPSWLVYYISPTVLMSAAANVCLYSKINLNKPIQKVVSFFSPAAFGVYLIHINRTVLVNLLTDRFLWALDSPAVLMIIYVAGCSLGVLIACLLIEKLRLLLFKVTKIDKLACIISDWVYKKLSGLKLLNTDKQI